MALVLILLANDAFETDVVFVFSMRRFGIEHFFKNDSYFTITIIPEIRAANRTKASVFFLFFFLNRIMK